MKKISAVFLTLIMTVLSASGCSAQGISDNSDGTEIILTINQPTMIVNGTQKNIDDNGTTPIISDNRTLLPVRAIVEAMGGNVEWNGDNQTVTLTKNNDTIQLTIGSGTALLNNEVHTLDAVPVVINDRTMLPIRFIAESFLYDVDWNENEQKVIISQNTKSNNNFTNSEKQEKNTVQSGNQVTVSVNGQDFYMTLEDNATAKAFRDLLPMTLEMDEMNGNEKYYYLDNSLPADSSHIGQIHTGDVMLYGSSCIVSFFKTFNTSYTYTRIGHIENADEYASVLPSGKVSIEFK